MGREEWYCDWASIYLARLVLDARVECREELIQAYVNLLISIHGIYTHCRGIHCTHTALTLLWHITPRTVWIHTAAARVTPCSQNTAEAHAGPMRDVIVSASIAQVRHNTVYSTIAKQKSHAAQVE